MARVKALIRILDVEKDTIGKILNKQSRIVFGNIHGSCEVLFEGRKDTIFYSILEDLYLQKSLILAKTSNHTVPRPKYFKGSEVITPHCYHLLG